MNKKTMPMILVIGVMFAFVALNNYNYGYGWYGYGSGFNFMTVPRYATIVTYQSYANVYVSGGISPTFLAPAPSYSSFYYGFPSTHFYNPRTYFSYIDP